MVTYKINIEVTLLNGDIKRDSKDLTNKIISRGFDVNSLKLDPRINYSPGFTDDSNWSPQSYQSGELSGWNAGSVVSSQGNVETSIPVRQDRGLYSRQRRSPHWNVGPIILKDKDENKIVEHFKSSIESIYDSDTIKVKITLKYDDKSEVLLDKEFNKRDFPSG